MADRFFKIAGGVIDRDGRFYFVDAHRQQILRYEPESKLMTLVRDNPLGAVNLWKNEHDFEAEVTAKKPWQFVSPDGSANIRAGRISEYTPEGKPIRTITVPERPVQLLLGGRDRRTLLIVARTAIYTAAH